MKRIFLIWFFLIQCIYLFGQVFSLDLMSGLPNTVVETSGLEANGPNKIWTHNDSGGDPELYELDTLGNILDTLFISNASLVDWEELAQDDQGNFYICDFGNNANLRNDLVIYKIPNPDSIVGDSATAELIHYSYSDQPGFPPGSSNWHYDMEACIWHDGHLYLFSKNRTVPFDGYTRLYKLPDSAGSYGISPIDSFYTGPGPMDEYWITAADISPDGKSLVLLSYDKLWLFRCFSGDDFFGGQSQILTFSPKTKYEGLVFVDNSTIYVSNEAGFALSAQLLKGDLGPFLWEPTVNLGPDISSTDNSVFISAGAQPGASILWSTGDTTEFVSVDSSGTYWVHVMMGACMATDTIVVNLLCESLALDAIVEENLCAGDTSASITLNINGGNPAYEVNWGHGPQDLVLDGLGAGLYTVLVTDSLGCSLADSFLVVDPLALELQTSVSGEIQCAGDSSLDIVATAGGGTPPYFYSWENGDTSMNRENLPAGLYSLSVRDQHDCEVLFSIDVPEPDSLMVTLSATGDSTGNSGTLSVIPTGGVAPYSYLWSNGSVDSAQSGLAAGWYSVTITDFNGCTIEDSIQVESLPPNSIRPLPIILQLQVRPNPSSGVFHLRLDDMEQQSIELRVWTAQGQIVHQESLLPAARIHHMLDLGHLAAGLYLLEVQGTIQRGHARLVVE